MFTTTVDLDEPLAENFRTELEKRLFFVSDKIVSFDLGETNQPIQEITLTTTEPVLQEQLTRQVNQLVQSDIASQRLVETVPVWQSAEMRHSYHADLFDDMLSRELVAVAGEGQITLGEPILRLMDYFDRAITDRLRAAFEVKEFRYPTLIPTQVLDACGYFSSFPHFLMFVTRLHNDLDVYDNFLNTYREAGAINANIFDYCQNTDYCLPPTMCYHTYHQYRDQQLEGNRVVTARGKSFRHESRYHTTLERLWDFTIREIVFLGSRAFVLDCRQQFMNVTFNYIDELGMSGYCEVASDPFFCDTETADKTWSQKMFALKYELRLNTSADNTIAAGSFNFHDTFFGDSFNIRQDADTVTRTACIGFGLERLTYAFLCQYGLDASGWPQQVRQGVAHAR